MRRDDPHLVGDDDGARCLFHRAHRTAEGGRRRDGGDRPHHRGGLGRRACPSYHWGAHLGLAQAQADGTEERRAGTSRCSAVASKASQRLLRGMAWGRRERTSRRRHIGHDRAGNRHRYVNLWLEMHNDTLLMKKAGNGDEGAKSCSWQSGKKGRKERGASRKFASFSPMSIRALHKNLFCPFHFRVAQYLAHQRRPGKLGQDQAFFLSTASSGSYCGEFRSR